MIDRYMNNFRGRLNEICWKNNAKQRRIAEKSGISTKELRRIMTGEVKDVRLSTFIQVAQAIGLTEEELVK